MSLIFLDSSSEEETAKKPAGKGAPVKTSPAKEVKKPATKVTPAKAAPAKSAKDESSEEEAAKKPPTKAAPAKTTPAQKDESSSSGRRCTFWVFELQKLLNMT